MHGWVDVHLNMTGKNMQTDIIQEYKTTHLPLATYLKYKNVQMVGISIDDKKRGTFNFVMVPRTFILDFDNGSAVVEPNEYANRMSQLVQTVRRTMEVS